MNMETLNQILAGIPSLRVALIGDGCVDIYWHADMRLSELSREVPQHPLPVVREQFSLGAGANVLANLAALGARNIRYVGCIGNDWRSVIFRKLLAECGISDEYLVSSDRLVTAAYCKPIRHGISPVTSEDPRLDFVNRSPIPEDLDEKLRLYLLQAAEDSDILIVCDQFANGCISEKTIDLINELGKKMCVIVDSRSRIGLFKNVIVKPNEVEACACLQLPVETIYETNGPERIVGAMSKNTGCGALVTLGEQGAIWCEDGICTQVAAVKVQPPIDFVGAGDSFLAGFSLAYIQKESPKTALEFANLVSSITIKKLGITGTASPDEMRNALDSYCLSQM